MIEVPVAWGELVDKITILEIKSERIADAAKLVNVRTELRLLSERLGTVGEDATVARLHGELKRVNESLWQIEDDIRDCERDGDFGPKFVELARAVYRTNDRRMELKREINLALGSMILEEKSYKPY